MFLTLVLIAMDYFFRRQKSTFNLENNKCIYEGNFFVYNATDQLTPEFFSTYISRIYTKL